jgi:hypothetical protein
MPTGPTPRRFILPKKLRRSIQGYGSGRRGTDCSPPIREIREEIVSDDGSLCRKILTHSFWDLIFEGRLTEALLPRTKNGRKKRDSGLLPVDHTKIVFLADKGHMVRSFARKHFALANEKTKELKLGCTTDDDNNNNNDNGGRHCH